MEDKQENAKENDSITALNLKKDNFCNEQCGQDRCTLPNSCDGLQKFIKDQEQIESVKNQPSIAVMHIIYRKGGPADQDLMLFSRLDKPDPKINSHVGEILDRIREEGRGVLAIGVRDMLESEFELINNGGQG